MASITEKQEIIRFSPKEESALLAESHEQKATANALFSQAAFSEAIDTYDQALHNCPNYLHYEVAVLKSNIAAAYLKLEDWKEADKAATAALDKLDCSQAEMESEKAGENMKREGEAEEVDAGEEIVSEGAIKLEEVIEGGKREVDVERKLVADLERIRVKTLMRRAKARSELGGWSNLQGAEQDYKTLTQMLNLSAPDRKIVEREMILLPPRTKAAQEKEMADMMAKLKQIGNGILKPFGLSTDNFQMQKDEKTGGYSMNFNQGASSS